MKKLATILAAGVMLAGCGSVEDGSFWEYKTVDGMDCILYRSGYAGSLDCDWSMRPQTNSEREIREEIARLESQLDG